MAAEPDQPGTATDDHKSLSGAPKALEDHGLYVASADETEQAAFSDDAPGEGWGMLESIPGVTGFDTVAEAPTELGAPVDGPLLFGAPWTWVLRLAVVYEDGSAAQYTGWLASPRVIVTCGRCLFDPSRGAAREVAVEVASSAGALSRRRVKSSLFKMVNGWVRSTKAECDYGAVLLPGAGLSGVGHFGLAWLPDMRPVGEWLNLAGYPAESSAYSQNYEGFRVADVEERFLRRTAGFHASAAGSPLWLYIVRNNRAQRYVCGMVGSNADSGEALRLHRDLYNNITNWVAEAAKEVASNLPAGG